MDTPHLLSLIFIFPICLVSGCQAVGCCRILKKLQDCTFDLWFESLLSISCLFNLTPSDERDEVLAPLFQSGCSNQITCRRGALALLILDGAAVLVGPQLYGHTWVTALKYFCTSWPVATATRPSWTPVPSCLPSPVPGALPDLLQSSNWISAQTAGP